ncbi:MAG: hypothetical protein Q7S88_00665 [Candidatus Daviesbacteria bacterium]|nr:hypothetical protein [Candidatus Daviesbacteria bacterium]
MMRQKGQVIVILLLIVIVALSIGLSIVGRTLNEIGSASKSEDSSRAFSAAEAGIERALGQFTSFDQNSSGAVTVLETELQNRSEANVRVNGRLPDLNEALEHPPISKGSFAQFWFVKPNETFSGGNVSCQNNSGPDCYRGSTIDLYFGDSTKDYSGANSLNLPAVEVNVIYLSDRQFKSQRYFFDSYTGSDTTRSNADFLRCTPLSSTDVIKTSTGENRKFYCKRSRTLPVTVQPNQPVLARVKLLYTDYNHPIALKPNGDCGNRCSLPYQANVYTSTGTSGNSIRTLQLFRQESIMPQMFDYALFSAGELKKDYNGSF